MSGSVRLALMLLATVFTIFIAVKVLAFLVSIVIPILVVLGVASLLYVVVGRKTLSGGRRTLP